MASLSNTQQREILVATAPHYTGLYWYAEARLPVRLRQDKFSDGYFPGAFPGRHIPVIPVGPDAQVSRAWCELLCGLFWSYQPAFEFAPMLTSIELLTKTGARWYVYGASDLVCDWCGGIGWESCTCGPVIRRVCDGF